MSFGCCASQSAMITCFHTSGAQLSPFQQEKNEEMRLFRIILYSRDRDQLERACVDMSYRFLKHSLRHDHSLFSALTSMITTGHQPSTKLWDQLYAVQLRLKIQHQLARNPRPLPSNAILDSLPDMCLLQCDDGTLHLVPTPTLWESRVLQPLLQAHKPLPLPQDVAHTSLVLPVPNTDSTTLAVVCRVLRQLSVRTLLADSPPELLDSVLRAADFLDIRPLFEAVWFELADRVATVPLEEVPPMIQPFQYLKGLESGRPCKFAAILCDLADAVAIFRQQNPPSIPLNCFWQA